MKQTHLTYGELIDRLRNIEFVEREIEEAKASLRHGGHPDTVKTKEQILADREFDLKILRNELVILTGRTL